MDVEIESNARPYYERMSLSHALACALEKIDEWDYEADAHGYCHERSVLVELVRGLEARGVDLPDTAYRKHTSGLDG